MFRNVTCKTTPVQRSRGHTAIGGAAYRAGVNLKAKGVGPNGEDKWYRYSPKGIVVRESFILTPHGAPEFAADRAELWNRVEAMETHKNARLGRDIELGLAYELTHKEQRAAVVEFAQREFVDKGFVVDVSIHNYGRTIPAIGASEVQAQRIRDWAAAGIPFFSKQDAKGQESVHVMEMADRSGQVTGFKLYQPHAHVRATPRPCIDGEFARDKYAAREMNHSNKAMQWRYEWPRLQNTYLERAGADVRVTSTSEQEDQFPDIRFLGDGRKDKTRAVAERAHELDAPQTKRHEEVLSVREADEAFRQVHNDTIKETFTEIESSTGSSSEEGAQARLGLWWQRQSERFSQWRFDFKDAAEEWRERLAQQANRLQKRVGSAWRAGKDREIDPAQKNHSDVDR